MARKLRFCPVGVPQHVIQRGNNRQICFGSQEDFKAYLSWLSEYSERYHVRIHAWVLMTNHVHILCTPMIDMGISKLMQALGRKYVRYFNYTYQRTGTLWEGRYKSCLVSSEDYLLHLYRYIELNPVRAGMVDDPAEYSWSSYQCNGLGKRSLLQSPHPLYLNLHSDAVQRCKYYRSLFKSHVEGDLLDDIRKVTNKGLALGNESFIAEMERLGGTCLKEQKRGRKV